MSIYDGINSLCKRLRDLTREKNPATGNHLCQDELMECLKRVRITEKRKAILIEAATPTLRSRFEEAATADPESKFFKISRFKNRSQAFRYYITHAYADSLVKSYASADIYNMLAEKSDDKQEKTALLRCLLNVEHDLKDVVRNYRIICGGFISPKVAMQLDIYEKVMLPETQRIMACMIEEMRFSPEEVEEIQQNYLKGRGAEHLAPIDAQQWRYGKELA